MSRGFVKEDDLEHAGTDLPERPLSPHPNYVTPLGWAELQSQAQNLDQERLTLQSRKEEASAQQRLAMIDRDLRYLSAKIQSAIVVDPSQQSTNTVLFGATVELEDENGDLQRFSIVGEDEADAGANKVSWVSPLARALLGHKLGDEVVWQRPVGNIRLTLLNIIY
jgi:transcription elongation factor GreB